MAADPASPFATLQGLSPPQGATVAIHIDVTRPYQHHPLGGPAKGHPIRRPGNQQPAARRPARLKRGDPPLLVGARRADVPGARCGRPGG